MSMSYVNTTYGTAFKRGMIVVYTSPNAKPNLYRVLSASYQIHAKSKDGTFYFHPRDLLPAVRCTQCDGSGCDIRDGMPGSCVFCDARGYHVLTWEQYRETQS